MYANKVLALTDDPVILASARLAIGMSHTNLACKGNDMLLFYLFFELFLWVIPTVIPTDIL